MKQVVITIAYTFGLIVGYWIWAPSPSTKTYEDGVKDCLNNKVKIEIKADFNHTII